MPKPYSLDFREHAVRMLETNTLQEVADELNIALRTVQYWDVRAKENRLEADPWGGGRPFKTTAKQRDAMIDVVKKQPDMTLTEIQIRLALPLSLGAICNHLNDAGYSRKKRQFMQASAIAKMSKRGVKSSSKKPKTFQLKS